MTDERDELIQIAEWIMQLRQEHSLGRVVEVVAERTESSDGEEYHFLARELVWLLREAGRNVEAIEVLDQLMDRFPDDVHSVSIKAHIYLWAFDRPEEALNWINISLERARRTGFFHREVLGDKARILLKLYRGDELSDVLEEIMSLQMKSGVPDVARERDFVDRAPRGLIRKNVLDRYNEFRPKRPSDSLADEPPPYEPAKDVI